MKSDLRKKLRLYIEYVHFFLNLRIKIVNRKEKEIRLS